MFQKKNIPLILGFSLPLLMVIFVVASIYLPGLFVQPTYNFLYSVNGNAYDTESFSVTNDRLIKIPASYPPQNPAAVTQPKLFVHDVARNTGKEISWAQAQNLKLDSNTASPDGFKIEHGGSSDGFFIFGGYNRDYNSRYIVGKGYSQKLDLNNPEKPYGDSIKFLGWIKK